MNAQPRRLPRVERMASAMERARVKNTQWARAAVVNRVWGLPRQTQARVMAREHAFLGEPPIALRTFVERRPARHLVLRTPIAPAGTIVME